MARKVKSVRRTVRKKKAAPAPKIADGTTPIDADDAFEVSTSRQGSIGRKSGGGGGRTQIKKSRRKRGANAAGGEDDGEIDGAEEGGEVAGSIAPIGGFEESDNFGGSSDQSQQEAFQQFQRGLVEEDRERVVAFGNEDSNVVVYDPSDMPSAKDVVAKSGSLEIKRAHRQYIDGMALDELATTTKIEKSAKWFNSIAAPDRMAKAILGLESQLELRPLEFYPCEILMQQMRTQPFRTREFKFQKVFSHEPTLQNMKVGHSVEWQQEPSQRYKMFAYLGRRGEVNDEGELLKERTPGPAYMFTPSKNPGKYSFRIDEPGEFCFAVLVAETQDLGKIKKELPGGKVDVFWTKVSEMGRKV